jgi:hypothetical protein
VKVDASSAKLPSNLVLAAADFPGDHRVNPALFMAPNSSMVNASRSFLPQ